MDFSEKNNKTLTNGWQDVFTSTSDLCKMRNCSLTNYNSSVAHNSPYLKIGHEPDYKTFLTTTNAWGGFADNYTYNCDYGVPGVSVHQ
jgi:hypothetical protein